MVEGGTIPYKPEALEKKKKNWADRRTNDPEAKCYMPGIPRANYMALSVSDRAIPARHSVRLRILERQPVGFNMGKPEEAGSDTWMGTNNGHWEGDTLVID